MTWRKSRLSGQEIDSLVFRINSQDQKSGQGSVKRFFKHANDILAKKELKEKRRIAEKK